MKKFFKYLLKVLGVAVFAALTAFIVIWALNTVHVTNADLSFMNNLPGWDKVLATQLAYPVPFQLLLYGVALLCLYATLILVLSLIPVLGKLLKGVVKFIVGGIVMFISVVLITIGACGIAGVLPEWLLSWLN